MRTLGFSTGLSGAITLDTPFISPSLTPGVSASTYIVVTGNDGVIVYKNSRGETKTTFAFYGRNTIAATEILSSGTTVTGTLYWEGSGT